MFWIVLAIVLASAIELSLRLLGFANPVCYVADEEIGYLLAPNQNLWRLGKQMLINAYSMRSADITPARSPNTLRVLLLGDSVAQGGWWTNQPDTIAELLRRSLAASCSYGVEVLNASASSWSPRNELAYLQRFGCFEAQIVVLLLNTDDLFGTAPTSVCVGRDRRYPNRKPRLALAEVVRRILPQPPLPEMQAILATSGDRVGANLAAIEQIWALAKAAGSQLIVAITPLKREIDPVGSRDYEREARLRLQALTQQIDIPYLDFLSLFNAAPDPAALYYDGIHLSLAGHQLVSDCLQQAIEAQQA